jgi:hypothetical protein
MARFHQAEPAKPQTAEYTCYEVLSMIPTDPVADALLEAFFTRFRGVNPFLDNRVNGPAAAEDDADAVHQHAFLRLIELAKQALEARRGLGTVVWGEAGIGKSHLLARLGRWADRDQHAAFIYLHNLQAAPEHLPRALLRHVLSVLTLGRRQRFLPTPLYALAHAGMVEAVGGAARYIWDLARQRFSALVDRLAYDDHPGAVGFDRSIYEVLFQFFRSTYRAGQRSEEGKPKESGQRAELAARWLAGQALEPHEAKELGLPPPLRRDDLVVLEDAQQIKQVLVALTRLAASRRQPFILAFDQVDNLDNEQFTALSRFLEALLDSAPNLLVVTAGVRASLERWREAGVVQHSAWDRLAQFEIALQRLNVEQAAQLIRVRLDRFLAPFDGLEAVQRRRREDAFFPLGSAWFQREFHERKDLRPRDVINWAREGWRRQQEEIQRLGGVEWLVRRPASVPPSPPPLATLNEEQRREQVDRLVEQRLAELVAQPPTLENLPADAEHLAGLLIALLLQCRDDAQFGIVKVESVLQVNGRAPTHTLNIVQQFHHDAPITTGVLVLTATKASSVTIALRRLAEKPPSADRFVLVTEERIGLQLGKAGKRYLDKIEHLFAPQFQRVQLPLTEYAFLQALQTVVRAARSGDLEITTRPSEILPVREAEVIASHHRRRRYHAARILNDLLAPLTKAVSATAEE